MAAGHKHKSDAFEAIHSSVAGMYRVGTVDKETMRDFDDTCLVMGSEDCLGQVDLKEPAMIVSPKDHK